MLNQLAFPTLKEAVGLLIEVADGKRNLQMPGDGRYQSKELKPFLGYDQFVGWLIIVEFFWMVVLARLGIMPESEAKLLTRDLLKKLLLRITTTAQDKEERKGGNHDILALLVLMRKILPRKLHRWLHFGATSYDIISTAYALQAKQTFINVFWPKIQMVDATWKDHIDQTAEIVQVGRTHLQDALPITVGFWLANLHSRFADSADELNSLSTRIKGKFSGAVGNYAAQRVLIKCDIEKVLMDLLDLAPARISTQIVPPESLARFYHEMVLLSGSLANLGEDVRILQSSAVQEISSLSSSSSTMAQKRSNPIAAEQMSGMFEIVRAEFQKIHGTLVTDLQRDLRGSCVMRSFSAVTVYVYQQLLTTERVFKNFSVDQKRCGENLDRSARLLVAELLHLSLQMAGYKETHSLVNKVIVPRAIYSYPDMNLGEVLEDYIDECVRQMPENWQKTSSEMKQAWKKVPGDVKVILANPQFYIGRSVEIARAEANRKLTKMHS